MVRLAPGGLAAVVCALLATGCGSGAASRAAGGGARAGAQAASVPATAYVTSLCTAVAPFEKDVVARSGALSEAGAVSAPKAKSLLVSYLGRLSHDSGTAVAKLRSAGIPQVSDGKRFASAILTTFTRLARALTRSEQVAARLPTGNEAAFKTSAATLADAVKSSVGQLGAGLGTRGNRALDTAAAKVSACHSL